MTRLASCRGEVKTSSFLLLLLLLFYFVMTLITRHQLLAVFNVYCLISQPMHVLRLATHKLPIQ